MNIFKLLIIIVLLLWLLFINIMCLKFFIKLIKYKFKRMHRMKIINKKYKPKNKNSIKKVNLK